ncbi:hypothetical protein KZP23_12440 [Echinicola marina]|uniref:hypothetical protein n=1 Tax=Echinicola marina TaxID=2859768 RepID=UPI001CF64DB3|nr:hypothetical protein [Echinicola marina]UCS91566.1 hypothetical protein KZP23_12440 [Echinicola marina]
MKNLSLLCALMVFVVLVACGPNSKNNSTKAAISASIFEEHIVTLSSDEFMGRLSIMKICSDLYISLQRFVDNRLLRWTAVWKMLARTAEV